MKILFAGLIVLSVCLGATPQNRILTGTISMTGQPVRGLTVYTSFASVQTDDVGRYAIPLQSCPTCRPGQDITIYTTHTVHGSTERNYTINNDYNFDFTIAPGRIVINGMVQSSGTNPGALSGIEVKVLAGDIDVPPVKTDSFGEFKIPIPRSLLTNSNAVRLQVRDPTNEHKPLRIDPELFSINSFITIKMEPSRSIVLMIEGFTRTTICVKKFDLVSIEASGQIRVGSMVGTSDPDGRTAGVFGMSLESYNIVSLFNHAALMYRMVGDSKWQVAGKRKRFMADRDGCIEFQINDNTQGDNYGHYTVEISVTSN